MANGHGGQRTPSNPAPVSNPGAGSARTDGGPVHAAEALSSGAYGETQALGQIAGSAPMPSDPRANQALAAALGAPSTFGAGSAQPGTPVTAGAQYGAGPGPSALGLDSPDQQDINNFRRFLPVLIEQASREGTPDSFKQAVRMLAAKS